LRASGGHCHGGLKTSEKAFPLGMAAPKGDGLEHDVKNWLRDQPR